VIYLKGGKLCVFLGAETLGIFKKHGSRYTEYSGQFKKDAKLCKKRNCNLDILENVVTILIEKGELPPKNKPHI
jgi:hypothetical protein